MCMYKQVDKKILYILFVEKYFSLVFEEVVNK